MRGRGSTRQIRLQPEDPGRDRQHRHLLGGPDLPLADLTRKRYRDVRPRTAAVDFPAAASYITDNKLTGTPAGRFGEVGYVAVDSVGNLYVTDWGKKVIDEFDSTGTFIRSFPSPLAHPGYFTEGLGGVAIDPTNGNVLISEGSYNRETGAGGVEGIRRICELSRHR